MTKKQKNSINIAQDSEIDLNVAHKVLEDGLALQQGYKLKTVYKKIAVGYVRYSSNNQREESIDAQKRAIADFCNKNNMFLLKFYEDHAKSGTTTKKRDAFNQMIKDSFDGEFQVVVIHKLDRFARNKHDSIVSKSQLQVNGVAVVSVLENIDGNSPESGLLESVIEGVSEFYVKNLAREVKKGLNENAIKAKHCGGRAVYGMVVDPITKKLVINPYEAVAIKLIFEMFDDGYSYSKIIETLKSRGFKTKMNNEFKKSSLHDILVNCKYRGCFTYNLKTGKNAFGKRNNHKCKPEEEVIRIEGGCDRIIDDELFFRVQERMEQNKKNTGEYKTKENYLLRNKILCGECGSKLSGSRRSAGSSKKLYITYKCNNSECCNKEINKSYLENFTLNQLKSLLFNKNKIDQLVINANQYIQNNSSTFDLKIQEYKNQLNGINQKINNILSAIEDGMAKASFDNRLDELQSSKTKVLAEIDNLELLKSNLAISKKHVAKVLKRFRSSIYKNDIPEVRQFISQYVDKVVVYADKVEILLKKIS